MKVLVTGGFGHIGSALLRSSLKDLCSQITIVDDMSTDRYCSFFNLPTGCEYVTRIGDAQIVVDEALVSSVDTVIHLAGRTNAVASHEEPTSTLGNNLRITKHIVDLCSQVNTPLVFASSTSVYSTSGDHLTEQSDTSAPQSPYAECKLQEEEVVASLSGTTPYLIFRFGTIFGPSPGMRFHTAVNRFCWQASNRLPVTVWQTSLKQRRPYLHLEDALLALCTAARLDELPDQIVNVASLSTTVETILDEIRRAGLPLTVNLVESAVMNTLSYGVSTTVAESLGISSQGSLQSGIRATLKLLNGLPTPDDDQSH